MSAVMQQQTFEQRLMGRIKESIGELMSEEDLKKIVERGVEEALFKPRIETADSYGRTVTKPPMMQEVVEKLLSTQVREAVNKWLAENQDKVLPTIEKVIKDGAGKAMIAALDSMMDYTFQNMGHSLMENLRRGG